MNDLQKRLADKKVIDIAGTINFDVAVYAREALMLLASNGAPDVLICINSPGGDPDSGLEIYDLIRAYPGKTVGFALTRAGSAACTILQACTIRAATPNAKVLIHHTKFQISWDVLTDPVKLAEFIRTKGYYLNSKHILARRTNKDLDEIFRKCEDDTWIPSQEALEFGLIDQIVEKADDIKLS